MGEEIKVGERVNKRALTLKYSGRNNEEVCGSLFIVGCGGRSVCGGGGGRCN